MKYKILEKKYNYSRLNLEVEFNPKNDILNTFFSSIDLAKLGEMLNLFCKEKSYYQSPMSVRFYKELDWEDLQELEDVGVMTENDVVVYHEVYGDFIIKTEVFFKLILDYAKKIVEVYNKELEEDWYRKINEGVLKLSEKLS